MYTFKVTHVWYVIMTTTSWLLLARAMTFEDVCGRTSALYRRIT